MSEPGARRATGPDPWDPQRYERFRAEREQPGDDLLALVTPVPGGRVVDLGCGTGRLTARLHEHCRAADTLGIDTSVRMLEQAEPLSGGGVRFEARDLRELDGTWDVIFANAALQWLPDHGGLLLHLVDHLAERGQLAFQVPANFDHPSHVIADRVGRRFGLAPLDRRIGVDGPARYAEILWAAGLGDLDVSLRIYGVAMDRTDEVVDWVSGTLLTTVESQLDPVAFANYRSAYREELLQALGDPTGDEAYFYAFPRILCYGRRTR